MMASRLFLFVFAAALLAAFGCSNGGDATFSPTFACTDGGAPVANAVTMVCGGTTSATQQVDVVLGGPATLTGLSFNVMYDGDNLVYDSFDASAASQLFPGALISVVPSTEPNSVPGYKDVVVAIQMTGGVALTDDVGQHLVLSLTFQRASGTTFGPTPMAFNIERTMTATPATAGTTFASSLMLSYR
jgi:hypothetical protein